MTEQNPLFWIFQFDLKYTKVYMGNQYTTVLLVVERGIRSSISFLTAREVYSNWL